MEIQSFVEQGEGSISLNPCYLKIIHSLPNEVIKETEELNDILDKVLNLDSNVKPLESTDSTLVDIINKVMTESDTTDESILNTINTEWSNP